MSKTSVLSGAVLAATLFLFAGCGGDDDDFAGYCKKSCETSAAAKCSKAATCVADCEKEANELAAASPNCKSQLAALGNCASGRPGSDWTCSAEGEPELKDNVCNAEGEAALACILGVK